MFCANCGKEIKEGIIFCPYCGASKGKAPATKEPEIPGTEKSGISGYKNLLIAIASVIAVVIILVTAFGNSETKDFKKAIKDGNVDAMEMLYKQAESYDYELMQKYDKMIIDTYNDIAKYVQNKDFTKEAKKSGMQGFYYELYNEFGQMVGETADIDDYDLYFMGDSKEVDDLYDEVEALIDSRLCYYQGVKEFENQYYYSAAECFEEVIPADKMYDKAMEKYEQARNAD